VRQHAACQIMYQTRSHHSHGCLLVTDYASRPITEYLASRKLSDTVTNYVLYAIALLDHNQHRPVSRLSPVIVLLCTHVCLATSARFKRSVSLLAVGAPRRSGLHRGGGSSNEAVLPFDRSILFRYDAAMCHDNT